MSMTNASSYVAFGTRGVAKLLETIDPSAPPADLAKTLATLNSLLSSQENKMQALANDGKVMSVLTGLLANASSDVRCQSALAIASLTLVMQGRIAAADASTVAALSGPLSDDVVADVRAACASAVESLTSSRDGCSVVTAAPSIAAKLTVALDDLHKPVVKAASVALSNLLRLDLGVAEALTAGVVSKLAHLITQIETTDFDARLLQTCLQALWNLANTPEGKQQAIHVSRPRSRCSVRVRLCFVHSAYCVPSAFHPAAQLWSAAGAHRRACSRRSWSSCKKARPACAA